MLSKGEIFSFFSHGKPRKCSRYIVCLFTQFIGHLSLITLLKLVHWKNSCYLDVAITAFTPRKQALMNAFPFSSCSTVKNTFWNCYSFVFFIYRLTQICGPCFWFTVFNFLRPSRSLVAFQSKSFLTASPLCLLRTWQFRLSAGSHRNERAESQEDWGEENRQLFNVHRLPSTFFCTFIQFISLLHSRF